MQKRRKKTSKEERVCSICSQSFRKAEHLLRHMRSHTKEKPFRCPVCDKLYAREDTLLRHSRSHNPQPGTGEEAPAPTIASADSFRSDPTRALPASVNNGSTTGHGSDLGSYGMMPRGRPTLRHSGAPPLPTSYSMDETSTLGTVVESEGPINTRLRADLTAAMPSVGEGGVRQSDLMPHWNLAVDPQWSSFGDILSGTDMNLSPLDLSLLSHGGEYSVQLTMDAVSETPPTSFSRPDLDFSFDHSPRTGPEYMIQRNWHTFCGHASSGHVTPEPVEEPYRVDEAFHRTLADKLQPRVQHDALPSTAFLDLCVQTYFAHFHPIFPIIHAPSFRPNSQNGLLLLSICSVGSLFLGSPRAIAHGISMYERLNKAMLAGWDGFAQRTASACHLNLQASVIGQTLGLLLGRPRDLLQIELYHGTTVAWARHARIFHTQHPYCDIAELSGQQLENAWRKWGRQEEETRTALALILLDSQISHLFQHEAIIQHSLGQLPSTSSKEAFAATTATSWKRIMMEEAASDLASSLGPSPPGSWSTSSPSNSLFRPVLNVLELCVMLERIGRVESRSYTAGPESPQAVLKCQTLLISWLEQYQLTQLFRMQAPSLMMLWHSNFMLLNMNLDLLECASGREGPDMIEDHREAARAWARSPQATRCMIHAILSQRQFEQLPLGSEPPIHAPICLYRCGMAWYCYAQFGGTEQPRPEGTLDMPELEALGIDGARIFREELDLQAGKPLDSVVLRIVDLLQRIVHWKVAGSLASTLLLLIGEH